MTIYFVLLSILLLSSFLSKCKGFDTKLLYLICLILLILIASFKALTVGTDSLNYYILFNNLSSYKQSVTFGGTQVIFYYYNVLINYIGGYDVYMISCYTIILGGVSLYIFKCSKNVFVSIIVFYLLFFLGSLNVMRQYMSIGIYAIGLIYLSRNDVKKYIVLVILAGCFHFSALLMLPLAFIQYLNIPNKLIIIITIISFYIGFFANIMAPIIKLLNIFSFLNENAAGYIMNWGSGDDRNIVTNAIINGAFIVSFFICKNKNALDIRMWFMFIVFSNLFGAAGQANRIFLYLLLGAVVAIPNIMYQVKSNKIVYLCYVGYISIYIFAFWFTMLMAGTNDVVPYKFR